MDNSGEMSIADQLAAQQQEISVAEFFEQNRQMLGFGSNARSVVTTVKEAVDNAIDASEEASVLPTITIDISETENDNIKITVTDNGPGIKEEQIPKIFGKLLYGSRFSRRVQTRGQQGIGISAAVLYAQQSTGKPAEITSKVAEDDTAQYFKVRINTDDNEPEIPDSYETPWEQDTDHGTSITLYIDGNFRARSRLHDYIKYTAIVNPHVTIHFTEPNHEFHAERTVETLPEKPEEIRPHPHGIDLGALRKMLERTDSHSVSGFLQSEFTRVGQSTANKIIHEFKDRINGRHMRWQVPSPTAEHTKENGVEGQATLPDSTETNESITLKSHVAAHVNRKPSQVTETYAENVSNELHDNSPVSWVETQKIIRSVAEMVEEDLDVTIGDTVREKTADAAWSVITTTREKTLTHLIDEATSSKKTHADIETISASIATLINNDEDSGYDTYTRKDIISIVDDAVDTTSNELDNTFGETSKSNIVNTIWEKMDPDPGDPPLIRQISDERELIEDLRDAMKSVSVMAPPSHCLSPIGESDLEQGIRKVFDAEFYSTSQRDARAHSGEPFIVEAGIAHGGEIDQDGSVQLLRFANRVPLVYKKGACAITNVVSNIRWNNYKLSDKGGGLPQGPVAIVVHIASTNVPFTSESKDAVASVSVIEDEIERAVRDVARDMKRYLKKQNSLKQQRRKQEKIDEILPEMAVKLSAVTGKPQPPTTESIARIMNNVFIEHEQQDDGSTITIRNYNDRNKFDVELQVVVDEYPDELPENATVTEQDNGQLSLTIPVNIAAGDEHIVHLPGTPTINGINYDGVEQENVSVAT